MTSLLILVILFSVHRTSVYVLVLKEGRLCASHDYLFRFLCLFTGLILQRLALLDIVKWFWHVLYEILIFTLAHLSLSNSVIDILHALDVLLLLGFRLLVDGRGHRDLIYLELVFFALMLPIVSS